MTAKDLINWSNVSKLRAGNRTTVHSNYKNGKHKVAIKMLLWTVEVWISMQKKL